MLVQASPHPCRLALILVGRLTAVAVLFALAGCSPAEANPSPVAAATPTARCTPLFGGDPYACDEQELDDLTADRARYDEAAALYEDVTRQIEDLLAAKEPMDEALASKLSGTYLTETREQLAVFASSGADVAGRRSIDWIRPLERQNLGSDLAVEVCSSPGDFTVTVDGQPSAGHVVQENVFFIIDGTTMKLDSSKHAEVETC